MHSPVLSVLCTGTLLFQSGFLPGICQTHSSTSFKSLLKCNTGMPFYAVLCFADMALLTNERLGQLWVTQTNGHHFSNRGRHFMAFGNSNISSFLIGICYGNLWSLIFDVQLFWGSSNQTHIRWWTSSVNVCVLTAPHVSCSSPNLCPSSQASLFPKT